MLPRSTIQSYVQLTRPQNVSGSVLTYCIGYALVAGSVSYDFFVGLVILLALHSLATIQNDIEDFEIDKVNKRETALLSGSLSVANAKFFVRALTFTVLVLALLSPHRRLHLIAIAGLLLVAWVYNLNPIRASKKPIMSIAIMGLSYGVLPFAYGYFVAQGSITANYILALVLFWFFARFSTAILKDYKDAVGDKKYNKDTFYLHYGGRTTAWTSIITSLIAYIGLITLILVLKTGPFIFSFALALGGFLALRGILLRFNLTKTRDENELNRIFHQVVFGHNQFEGAILLCLILSSK